MVITSAIVNMTSLVMNLICSFIVPCVERIAYTVRIGDPCGCPSPPSSPAHHSGRKHKKMRGYAENGHHKDVKRIKLLLDITVGRNGSKVLDIQATARAQDDGYNVTPEGQQCKKNPGIILRLLNLPSSVMLYIVSKFRKVAHDLKTLNNPPYDDRVKKSPKRRMTPSNYRRIIPFFPFNLLGFSNYSAFQMPSITRSSSSTADEANNLNISSASMNGKEKTRCKRRRNSSTEQSSDFSDDEISYLEYPEKSNETNGKSPNGGVDEVDSDETADTVTKKTTSSSSSNENNPQGKKQKPVDSSSNGNECTGKRILVTLNTSNSEDNAGYATSFTDFDSSGVTFGGDEQHVRFGFIEELNEAANESYNSLDDPDYQPPQSCSSTTDSSFATDKGLSDENSYLVENTEVSTNGEEKSENSEPTTNSDAKLENEEPIPKTDAKLKNTTPKTKDNGKQAKSEEASTTTTTNGVTDH